MVWGEKINKLAESKKTFRDLAVNRWHLRNIKWRYELWHICWPHLFDLGIFLLGFAAEIAKIVLQRLEEPLGLLGAGGGAAHERHRRCFTIQLTIEVIYVFNPRLFTWQIINFFNSTNVRLFELFATILRFLLSKQPISNNFQSLSALYLSTRPSKNCDLTFCVKIFSPISSSEKEFFVTNTIAQFYLLRFACCSHAFVWMRRLFWMFGGSWIMIWFRCAPLIVRI